MEPLKNLDEMREYIERKFTGEYFVAKASTKDAFGPVVRWHIDWTPTVERFEPCTGSIWCSPDYYTASVPFNAR
jgi:hypothetical protein